MKELKKKLKLLPKTTAKNPSKKIISIMLLKGLPFLLLGEGGGLVIECYAMHLGLWWAVRICRILMTIRHWHKLASFDLFASLPDCFPKVQGRK